MAEKYEGLAWEIALGVFGGLMLTGLATAVIGVILSYFAAQSVQVELAKQSAVIQNAMKALPQPHFPVDTTVNVPARSVEECNDLTNGVLNEEWKKCRSGYTKTIRQ